MEDHKATVRLWPSRMKDAKRLGFRVGESGFKFFLKKRWRRVDFVHRERRTLTEVHMQKQGTRMCGECQLSAVSRTAREIIPDIIETAKRFASIVRSMKETVIYLDSPSDIDFKCRVRKSKKCANVHGYSYQTWFIDSTAFSPVRSNIGVEEKK